MVFISVAEMYGERDGVCGLWRELGAVAARLTTTKSVLILRATRSAAGPLAPRSCHFEGVVPQFWYPRDHPGGSWEQHDGNEVVWNRIFIDFEMISDPCWKFNFVRTCFQVTFLSISEPEFRCWGLPNRGFCKESVANVDFPQNFCLWIEALGAVFPFCLSWKQV